MAPLPSNTTGVFYLDYHVEGEDHTLQIRFGEASSALEAASVADAFLAAVEDNLFLLTVLGARVRDAGGSVSYPVDWDGANTYGAGTTGHYASGIYMDFVGRSIDGRRCRISVFGAQNPVDSTGKDYRFTTDTAWVSGGLAALESLANCPVSISGEPVNWQQYANVGINAYWRNKIR
jgi:hypothetical protein